MAKTSTDIQFFSASDIGQVRTTNQDFFGNKEDANLFLVADGMGGHAGGERASRLAVETVLGKYDFGAKGKPNVKSIKAVLKDAIKTATRVIHEEAAQNFDLQQMGTTIVALVLHGRQAILAHVGDSRIYRLRDSKLEQLTVDHSFVQEQIDAGIISVADSKDHRMKNVITRALGAESDVEVDINTIRVEEGDVFLLCSDGLHGMASDSEILGAMLAEPDLEKCCQNLTSLANTKGGKDNVTATLVRVVRAPGDGLARAAAIAGVPIAIAASILLALYFFTPLLRPKPPSTPGDETVRVLPGTGSGDFGTPTETAAETEARILELRKTLEDEGIPVDTRIIKMLALAAAETQAGDIRGAQMVAEELLSFCIANDRKLEISDIEDPLLKDIVADSQSALWVERLKDMNEKIENYGQDDLKKYSPGQLQAALSMISQAKEASAANELFRALSLLDDANTNVDEAISVSNERRLAQKREAERLVEQARQEIARIAVYDGKSYKAIVAKRKAEETKLREAEKYLASGDYDESAGIAGIVIDHTGRILREAREIEGTVLAFEKLKNDAAAVSGAVEKKWKYINSDQFKKVPALFQRQAYASLVADHEEFESRMSAGDYEKVVLLGKEFVKRTDMLVRDTGIILKDRIASAEKVLLEKGSSGKNYEESELVLGVTMLDEARVLADMQFIAKAFERVESLEELIANLKEKKPEPAVPDETAETDKEELSESLEEKESGPVAPEDLVAPVKPDAAALEDAETPVIEQPPLSAPELQNFILASGHAGTLETYIQRSIELFRANKRTRAKNLLQEHSKGKFDDLSNLISSDQEGLRYLLDEAYELCLGEQATLATADVQNALEKIRLLKKKLEEIIAANQAGR